jgi:myo-inositol-1-phosphate synthase
MQRRSSKNIKVAIIGIGNCASSLIQGIHYYQNKPDAIGLLHDEIGGYRPGDIEVVAAFDIDKRKVGIDLSQAIFSLPNCTTQFEPNIPLLNTIVQMGNTLDGVSAHMLREPHHRTFILADQPAATKEQVVAYLKESKAEILINYLPVGSQLATEFYVECALEAGLGFINNIPVFIASQGDWAKRFEMAGLPLIGDDIKSQMGATIIHRAIVNLFKLRGVKLERTYQINTGGNTDFLNMLNRERLQSKKISKTEAVQSACATLIEEESIHIGPSDYVPWQNDNKVCFIRLEGKLFGDVPMNMEIRLSVEDSPNSAGVVIDAIRCCKLALDRKEGGVLAGPSAFFCKHPYRQYPDELAYQMTEHFIQNELTTVS